MTINRDDLFDTLCIEAVKTDNVKAILCIFAMMDLIRVARKQLEKDTIFHMMGTLFPVLGKGLELEPGEFETFFLNVTKMVVEAEK